MSDEIIKRLDELMAGQGALVARFDQLDGKVDRLNRELHAAIRQSNQSIISALGSLRGRVEALELKAS